MATPRMKHLESIDRTMLGGDDPLPDPMLPPGYA